jgi:exonuclease III
MPVRMKLVTWNLGRKERNTTRQLEVLTEQEADIVALQEVTRGALPHLETGLRRLGLEHTLSSFQLGNQFGFGKLIASRWPLEPALDGAFDVPYPERILSALIQSPEGKLELHNVHVPAAASSGVDVKIGTFNGLYRRLTQPVTHKRILCGDFNTPKAELPDGTTLFWGTATQQQAEREVILGLARFDLVDAYRALHGFGKTATSWHANNGVGRRYDHVFASSSLKPEACDYLDSARLMKLSDHAPLAVCFTT